MIYFFPLTFPLNFGFIKQQIKNENGQMQKLRFELKGNYLINWENSAVKF